MKKRVSVAVSTSIDQYETYRQLRVSVTDAAVRDWILGLVLLETALVDTLVFVSQLTGFELRISVDRDAKPPSRATGVLAVDRCDLQLTQTELESWMYFYLKLHRDGMTSVDHIDVEVAAGSGAEDEAFDVTLYSPSFGKPMSAEEARRRLGLQH